MRFADRADAGRRLARALVDYRNRDPVVLALPRGGLPVAAEIASALAAPLDVVLARKIGVPWQPELAMGALVEGDEPIVARNEAVIKAAAIDERAFAAATQRARVELEDARRRLLGDRPREAIAGRAAILVDDGVATGATARAALLSIRRRGAKTLTLAVPVASAEALAELRREVDDLVCLERPTRFGAVSAFYADFRQVTDEEAVAILARFSPAAR
ncbi:MAG: phosphoribosyltransferase family protein [Roseiarcus sp.]|jgi:predicted phosphoribosyltransferase|uniref:phosphoribosyltransferase n=1 Tax=Roseiarcus sp. TaxID=1969460 RepID=UPI003C1F32AC